MHENGAMTDSGNFDAAWLPDAAFRAVGARRSLVRGGPDPLKDTVRAELVGVCARFGGEVVRDGDAAELVLDLTGEDSSDEGYTLERRDGVTTVTASGGRGLLYGLFHVVRLGEGAFAGDLASRTHRPALATRMLDHWDNVAVHPVMGQVERGYAGGSLFWADGVARGDLARVRAYGRLLAACGINAVAVNNVNVHATEARLLTDRIGDVAAIAALCGRTASARTSRSASPRRSCWAGCPPPTRWTRPCAPGGLRRPPACTRPSPTSAGTS